jgi:hypothetical protein
MVRSTVGIYMTDFREGQEKWEKWWAAKASIMTECEIQRRCSDGRRIDGAALPDLQVVQILQCGDFAVVFVKSLATSTAVSFVFMTQ